MTPPAITTEWVIKAPIMTIILSIVCFVFSHICGYVWVLRFQMFGDMSYLTLSIYLYYLSLTLTAISVVLVVCGLRCVRVQVQEVDEG